MPWVASRRPAVRILVITPIGYDSARSGGAEAYAFELMRLVAQRTGIEVTVLTSGEGCERPGSPGNRLQVERLSRGAFAFPFMLLLRARKYVKDADVVVENVSKFPLVVPALISRLSKRPFVAVVHHVHGRILLAELPLITALCLLLYEYALLLVYALLRVPVVTVSRASEAELRRLRFREVRVVHPPLPRSADNAGHGSHAPGAPLLVYFGRVKKYKRLDHVVRACRRVIERLPSAFCLIVGKGDARVEAELRRLATELGIGDRLKVFAANVSDELKLKVLRRAWVYVFTSMKEGFGISVLEALSQGVPVVAYDIPAMREVARRCGLGILARNGDVEGLAELCIGILEDEKRLQAMSSRARECAKAYAHKGILGDFLEALWGFLRPRKSRG